MVMQPSPTAETLRLPCPRVRLSMGSPCRVCAPLSCRLSAVDNEGVAEQERSRVRAEPDGRSCDLFGSSHAPDRLLRDHRVASFGCAAAEAMDHRSVNDAG